MIKQRLVTPFQLAAVKNTSKEALQILGEIILDNFRIQKLHLPVRVENYEEFIRITSDTLHIDLEKAKPLVDYMTFVVGRDKKFNILEKPFIKIGEAILSIPALISEGDNFVIVLNKLLRSHKYQERNKERNNETKLMEDDLAKKFQENGFHAAAGISLLDDGFRKDIDCVAVKDNTIILCELKSTYVRSSLKEAYHHREQTLKKAAKQLEIRIDLIYQKKYFDRLMEKLELDHDFDDLTSGKIKIYPLIVSSSFEHDGAFFGTNHSIRKISLLELKIILDNDKKYFFSPESWMEEQTAKNLQIDDKELTELKSTGEWYRIIEEYSTLNTKNGNFQEILKEEFEKDFILYKENEISVDKFIDIIEEEKVWDCIRKKSYTITENDGISLLTKNSTYHKHTSLFIEAGKLYEEGKFKEALVKYNAAIEIYDEDPDYFAERGNCKAQLKLLKESLKDFDRSILLGGSQKWSAYMNRGLSYYELKYYNKALEDFNSAIKTHPNEAIIYMNRSLVWAGMKDANNYKKDLYKAYELEPTNPKVLQNIRLFGFHEFFKSIEKENLTIEELHVRAHAKINFDIDEAMKDYQKILEIDENHPYGFQGITWCHINKKEYKEAGKVITKALELHPNNSLLHDSYANLLALTNKFELALKHHDKSIELDPNMPDYYHNRSCLFESMGLQYQAIKDAEKALELNPSFYLALNKIYELYTATGNYALARLYKNKLNDMTER